MHILAYKQAFPPVEASDEHGLLAIGGDLSEERLIEAYHRGIFPWYDETQPILWWSPDPRMVVFPEKVKISRSMKQLLKKEVFQVSYNQRFEEVIDACSKIKRKRQDGTWITGELKEGFLQLHEKGMAQSVEVWQEEKLVGGLYGVYLEDKQVFCGESMFSKVSNASKFGFIKFAQKLREEGGKLIDCQVYTPHLESLGGEEIPRVRFLEFLK